MKEIDKRATDILAVMLRPPGAHRSVLATIRAQPGSYAFNGKTVQQLVTQMTLSDTELTTTCDSLNKIIGRKENLEKTRLK